MAYFQPLASNWIEIEAAASGLETVINPNQNYIYFSVIKFPVSTF